LSPVQRLTVTRPESQMSRRPPNHLAQRVSHPSGPLKSGQAPGNRFSHMDDSGSATSETRVDPARLDLARFRRRSPPRARYIPGGRRPPLLGDVVVLSVPTRAYLSNQVDDQLGGSLRHDPLVNHPLGSAGCAPLLHDQAGFILAPLRLRNWASKGTPPIRLRD